MGRQSEPADLEQLLDRIEETARQGERVSFGAVLEVAGHRSFGPFLLIAGLITLAPVIGDIPGMPTVIAVFVFLVAVQLLFGRRHFWLPGWMLERSAESRKVNKALRWLRPPARFVDRFVRPRITVLTNGPAKAGIAAVCIVIAGAMPVMEVVPFSANLAGAALAAFGLALVAGDGLISLLAFLFSGLTIAFVATRIF